MKYIELTREPCCAQDNRWVRMKMLIDLPDGAMIWELAKKIGEAKFLQFSGTHNIIGVYCGQKLLFSIPAFQHSSIPAVGGTGGVVIYKVGREDSASIYLTESRLGCRWPVGI